MKKLLPEPLTAETFHPYGDVIETTNAQAISINRGNCLRYHDLAKLDIDNSGSMGVSVFKANHFASPCELSYVERHPLGSQAFIPMTPDPFLVIVADDDDGIAQKPRIFLTDGQQGVNYRRNTWHGVLTPIVSATMFTVIDYIGSQDNLEEYSYDTPYGVEF